MSYVPSTRDINELHPMVRNKAELLLAECERRGLNIGISETYRSVERQDYLYSLGRTEPGNIVTHAKGSSMSSYHQWRLAFDVFQNIKGQEYDISFLNTVGVIGEGFGLEWGGRWTGFVDRPHFQYTEGLTINDLKNGLMIISTEPWMYSGLEYLEENGVVLDYSLWADNIESYMHVWSALTFIKRVYCKINNIDINIDLPENYKEEGLRFFENLKLIDAVYWVSKLDEYMPVWTILTIISRCIININDTYTDESKDFRYEGFNLLRQLGFPIDYDYWESQLDKPMCTWALAIMLQYMMDRYDV